MFTQTVGDPERGSRIAQAILDDDEARAEVADPITSAVMDSTGLPPEQRPLVASQVDRLLQQPDGARTFVDTFGGRWSQMLGAGNGDASLSLVDISPFVTSVVAAVPGLDPAQVPETATVPADVPAPDADVPGLGTFRRLVEAVTLPLAIVAAAGIVVSMLIGDQRWVLRRVGIWGVSAGALWLIVPAIAVWAAERWATGADASVRVAVAEALSGLRVAPIVLCVGGVGAFVASFAVARAPMPASPSVPPPLRRRTPASAAPGHARRTVTTTMTMPVTTRAEPQPPAERTTRLPAQQPVTRGDDKAPAEDDADALWNFYTDPD